MHSFVLVFGASQPPPTPTPALKPCDSHANNAALCLLLLDSVWHLQQVSLAVVTFTWSRAAEVANPAGAQADARASVDPVL